VTASDQPVGDVTVWSHPASRRSTWVMVQVAAGGVHGVGELSDGGPAASLVAAARSVTGAATGRPVRQAREAVRRLLERRRMSAATNGSAFMWSTVLGGYESAFADLTARLARRPLSVELGLGEAGPVRAYANLNRRFGAEGTETVTAEAVRAAVHGYPAVKIAPFSGAHARGKVGAEMVRDGLDLAATVRAAVPPDTLLMVDCHNLVPRDLVGVVGRELAQLGVHWVEDLVDITDPDALQSAAAANVPLAGGEHVWDPSVAAAACGTGALAYWLLDPKHAGGPVGAARMAEAVDGTRLTFHNPSGPVGTAHAAHLAGLAGDTTWLEIAWGEEDRTSFLDPAETVTAGAFVPTAGPGIGCSPRRLPQDGGSVGDDLGRSGGDVS
jgi:galactonate dehydratase